MSFTKDELQALHSILEHRLSLHRRELERSLDQRMNGLRRDFEQRLVSMQQEVVRLLAQRLSEQQTKLLNAVNYKLDAQQTHVVDEITRGVTQYQQQQQRQFESFVENALAAQLLAMEQLIRQNLPFTTDEEQSHYPDKQLQDEGAIEVQTDISWEDLAEVIGNALDERLSLVSESLQTAIKDIEQHLSVRLYDLREELVRRQAQSYNGAVYNMQDVFTSIEQLERVLESMQVAMTSNHSLLTHRIYHHQQLPLERAHPSTPNTLSQERVSSVDNTSSQTDESNAKE